jgi:hypothetical protein
MPREIALLDALVPTLLFAFLAAGFSSLLLDWLFARYGIYRHLWYPALFRLAVFVCLFSAFGLRIY